MLIIGTAGGSGARPHGEWTWEIVEDILNETRQSASVAVIFSDVPKALIVEMIKQGRTSTCVGR